MRYLLHFTFLLSLFISGFTSGIAFAAKPSAPVALDIEYVEDRSSGHYSIELNVTNRGATAQYDIELQLPPGAQHFSGPLNWSGELSRGSSEQFLYEVSFDQQNYVDIFVKSGPDSRLVVRRRFNIEKSSTREKLLGIETTSKPEGAKERIRGPYIEYPLK